MTTSDPRRAIRDALRRLGMHATPKQVVEHLQRYGIDVSERLITTLKAQLLRQQSAAQREQAKRPPESKARRRPQQRKIPRQP